MFSSEALHLVLQEVMYLLESLQLFWVVVSVVTQEKEQNTKDANSKDIHEDLLGLAKFVLLED